MGFSAEDEHWMQRALALADQAEAAGEVPVGAVLVRHGELLGEGFNQPIGCNDATAHAEIRAIRAACAREANYRLPESTLYVTLEPCAMCAGAIVHARIKRVVFAAADPRTGAAESVHQLLDHPAHNHRVAWEGGLLADEAGEKLKTFFRQRR